MLKKEMDLPRVRSLGKVMKENEGEAHTADPKGPSLALGANTQFVDPLEHLERLLTSDQKIDVAALLASPPISAPTSNSSSQHFLSSPLLTPLHELPPSPLPESALESRAPFEEDTKELMSLRLAGEENGWLIQAADVEIGERIARGSTADICQGIWHGMDVAVKCITQKQLQDDPKGLQSFLLEVRLLARLRHPFILQLLGACLNPPSECWLLTELLSRGTLLHFLHGDSSRSRKRTFPLPPLPDRLRIALEISLAMQYLHGQQPKVIHRDLKPANIFLDSHLHVRVADFGFARFLMPSEAALTGETGTYLYMAPEVVRHEPYNEKCDVYSFAVLLNEILSGDPPFIESNLGAVSIACNVAKGKMRPALAKSVVPKQLLSLIAQAWSQDPAKRPSFVQITKELRASYAEAMRCEGSRRFGFH